MIEQGNDSDRLLIQRLVQEGDPDAFSAIMTEYAGLVSTDNFTPGRCGPGEPAAEPPPPGCDREFGRPRHRHR
jgi:hypothetical protein